ncbi:MAG TPA: sigma-70 family RNA polymerase sigma factor [Blastocatellia bacterium]|nr:sigma-70 family RNA polymerase sigma factor [Blastocatellia bacterium]HMV86145.1 sigma-70 family RNA polymerase sigma factor [Blastocatellia bacterium]HMX25339.1 sigma-70 family RNA polymerase sigma factor [Blastocatellia bacterium]HMY71027.1 sigma-70 family RNA polymerase sigma factor [Blastocatellia bacterium]HMZ18167.1 sigma-70 family RNA polymerase sigma factor [Blastocatellia bacterium]
MTAWGLTETGFEKLLGCLGPDREQAGATYEAIRRKLTRFFEWRGAPVPEECVDETFNRVVRRLEDGIAVLNPAAYCNEVARLVLLESLKGAERKLTSLDDMEPNKAEALASFVPNDDYDTDERLGWLEKCLQTLPTENRELILEFYCDDRRAKIDRRNALADRLSISRETLGKRAQRVRDKLEECVKSRARKK